MSDPNQNPRPDESGNPPPAGDQGGSPPPPGQSGEGGAPPPPSAPPPSEEQGSYGTQPPPPGGQSGAVPPPGGGPGYPPPPGGQPGYPPPPGGQPGYPPPPGGWQQPGAMPPPPRPTGGIGQPADLLPRFVARLIDFILLGVVSAIIVTFLVVGLMMGTNAGGVGGFTFDTGRTWAAGAVSSLIDAAIALGYFSLMEAKRGQTIGKMVMRLETRGPGGGRPTMEQAVKRNAWTAISVLGIIPFLGFAAGLLELAAVITIAVTISNNKLSRQGWHDEFAGGTQVIRIG